VTFQIRHRIGLSRHGAGDEFAMRGTHIPPDIAPLLDDTRLVLISLYAL